MAECQRRLAAYPRDANRMIQMAALTYVHGSASDACQWVEKALAIDATVSAWRYHHALCLEAADRTLDAIAEIEKYLATPGIEYGPGHIRLGRLLLQANPAQAEKALTRALELNPTDARAHFLLAELARASGDNEKALPHLEAATKLCPRYAAANRAAAEVLVQLARPADADRYRRQAARGGEPPSDDLLQNQFLADGLKLESVIKTALEEGRRGAFEKAESLLFTATGLDVGGVASRRGYGMLRVMQNRFEEAASIFAKALESEPEDGQTHGLLGSVYVRLDRYAEAIPHLQKSLDVDPDDPAILQQLGVALSRSNDRAAAERCFSHAIEVAPNDAEAYMRYVEVLLSGKAYEKAIAQMRAGLRQSPGSALLRNVLAWTLATCPDAKLRNGREATELAQALCAPGPLQRHEYFDTLAAALAESGLFSEAIQYVQRAIVIANSRQENAATDVYKSRLQLYERGQPYHDDE